MAAGMGGTTKISAKKMGDEFAESGKGTTKGQMQFPITYRQVGMNSTDPFVWYRKRKQKQKSGMHVSV